MLILHKSWSKFHPLDLSDKAQTIDQFKSMLNNNEFPSSVICQYRRVVAYSQDFVKVEVTSNRGSQEIYGDQEGDDNEELKEYVTSCNTFMNQFVTEDTLNGCKVDYGKSYNWKTKHFTGERDIELPGELYLKQTIDKYLLKLQNQMNSTDDILDLPK